MKRAILVTTSTVVGVAAVTRCEVEPPAVQGAHQLVAVDLAEHAEVGLAVRAGALHHIVADTNVFGFLGVLLG